MANTHNDALLKTFISECERAFTEQQSAITEQLNMLFGSLPIGNELIGTAELYLAAQSTSVDSFVGQLASCDISGKCNERYYANSKGMKFYRCFNCSVAESDGAVMCSSCFERGKHKQDDHAYVLECDMQAGLTVSCACGDASIMKQFGWCSQHSPQSTGAQAVRTTCETASFQRILPRLIARVLVQLRLDGNDTQLFPLCNFLVQLSLNQIALKVMWTTFCDEQWYADLFQSTNSTSSVQRQAVVNEQQRVACCDRFNQWISRITAGLGSAGQTAGAMNCECELVQKCALDELMFWLISLGFSKPVYDLLCAYSTSESRGASYAKYELGRALVRQGLCLTTGVLHTCSRLKDQSADDLNLLYMQYDDYLRHVLRDEEITVALESKDNLLAKVMGQLQVCLRRKFTLQATELTARCKSSSQSKVSVAAMALRLDSQRKVCHLAEIRYSMLIPCFACLHSHVAQHFLEGSGLNLLLGLAELFQGLQVFNRRRASVAPLVSLSIEIIFCNATVFALCNTLCDAPFHVERCLGSLWRGIDTTRSVLFKWLQGIGVQYDQSVDQVGSFTSPNEMTYNLPLHRNLAVLISAHLNLEHKYASRNVGAQYKQLLSAAECYYVLQHVLSTLCGDFELRYGLWNQDYNAIRYRSSNYHKISNIDSTMLLDLLLLQYCAAQCNADRFLRLVADRALHDAAVLSFSSAPCHAEAEQMSKLFESLALLLVWLLQEDRLITYSDERHCREFRRNLIASLSLSDCVSEELQSLIPHRTVVSVIPQYAIEQVLQEVTTVDISSVRKLSSASWQSDFDYSHCLLFYHDFADFKQILKRYLNLAGNVQDRDDASRRGVTIDTVWPPMHLPTVEQLDDFPVSIRPSNLPRCSTYYALVFAMLTRSTTIGVAYTSERNLTMYAVHLVRLALAYDDYDNAIGATANANSDSDKATVIDEVDELALHTWYPPEVCNNVYTCVLHTIGTMRMANQTEQCVPIDRSILTLLITAYEMYSQQNYLAPQSGKTVRRHELFATGADVIGALLDTLCCKSRSINRWFENGPEAALAGARLLKKPSIGSSSNADATNTNELPPPPPKLLKNLRITRAK